MTEGSGGKLVKIFIDTPARLDHESGCEQEKSRLRQELEDSFDERIVRSRLLPPIITQEVDGAYLPLLHEARTLFEEGKLYSCVAMCGIVAERITKDVMISAISVRGPKGQVKPSPKGVQALERLEASQVAKLLSAEGLLGGDALSAAGKLSELRNEYAHACPKGNLSEDALKAIRHLHSIVDETVSIFKTHTIKAGSFVRKSPEQPDPK